jgi:mono/diheme cytochrome c family protein
MKLFLTASVLAVLAVPALAQSPDAPASAAPATAAPAASAPAPAAAAPASGDKPYKVVDGTKVDEYTMKGFRTWRAASCDRCHGPNQEGLVGPSLIEGLKMLTKDEFKTTVTNGRLEKGMPSFAGSPTVMGSLDNLYAYLKARSDGALTTSHPEPIE